MVKPDPLNQAIRDAIQMHETKEVVGANPMYRRKNPNYCCISCRHLIMKEERQQCEIKGITRRAMSDAHECQKDGNWEQTLVHYPGKIEVKTFYMTYSYYETPREIGIIQTVVCRPFEAFSEEDAIKGFFASRDMHKMHLTEIIFEYEDEYFNVYVRGMPITLRKGDDIPVEADLNGIRKGIKKYTNVWNEAMLEFINEPKWW